ncbi:MAG: malectin [Bryobacter sp.]|jgi:hypothetical protein|nr:malectin [Bryobacter sp.]
MATAVSPQQDSQQRQAVQNLIDAGTFLRKPNQERLFRYLCERHFEGTTAQIKEYSLGADALGRGPDFDPKSDSIVRAEVRKLRKTLADYAEGPGHADPIRITLPRGGYVLAFESQAAPLPAPARKRGWLALLLGAAVLLAGFAAVLLRQPEPAPRQAPASPPSVALGPAVEHRILAGSSGINFSDARGRTWQEDRFFTGGRVVAERTVRLHNADDARLFANRREGDFTYAIPVPPGVYEVRLHFAELNFGRGTTAGGGESSRMFRITLNGKVAFDPLDVIAEAGGPARAIRKVILNAEPAKDGKLHLRFESLVADKAFVNAIEVVPGTRDRMLPLRLAANPMVIRDARGNEWSPDLYVEGGRVVARDNPVSGGPDAALFRSERFGHFRYRLPVVSGHLYAVRLWMSEQFFGVSANPTANLRRRLFDVRVGGLMVGRSLDILSLAGGPLKAVERTFRGVAPDAYGFIDLQFLPTSNYALINALEVLDEGPAR